MVRGNNLISLFYLLLLCSCSVVSDSLRPHGLQHARLRCPSLSPRACSNWCPLSWWCYPTISSCHPLLFLPSIFLSIRVFSNESAFCIRWPLSVFPMNIQGWFPLEWTGWISLQSKGLSRVFYNTTVQKLSILWCSAFFMVHLSHPYKTTGKTTALTRCAFVGQVMSLLFNMLSRFVIAKDTQN